MEISEKKVVKLNYTGKLSDGTVFDSSEGREPLEFIYGTGMIIPGLEKGLKDMKIGDKKTIDVKSEEAYGPRMDEAVQEVPKTQFPADVKLEVGMQLAAQGPQGVIPVTIAEVKEETVLVDFNHMLAGKDLSFEVEVLEVREATKEESENGIHVHKHEVGEEGCCGGDGSCNSKKEDSLEDCCGDGSCKTEDKKESKTEDKKEAKKEDKKEAKKEEKIADKKE